MALLVFLSPFLTYGQEAALDVWSPISYQDVSWTISTEAVNQKLSDREDTDTVYFGRVQTNLAASYAGNVLNVYVPHRQQYLEFEVRHMESDDARGFFGYYAEATGVVGDDYGEGGNDDELCSASLRLVASPSSLLAILHVDTFVYDIRSINNTDIAIYLKQPVLDTVSCDYCFVPSKKRVTLRTIHNPYSTNTTEALFSYSAVTINGDMRCVVEVVVASTPEAREEGVDALDAFAIIIDANLALIFSQIPSFRYGLVGYHELVNTSFSAQTPKEQVIPILTSNNEVSATKNLYDADQILVIAQSNAFEEISGASELTTAPADRDLTAVENGSASNYTGPHELAHNHGCKHQNDPQVGGPGQLQFTARGHEITPGPVTDYKIMTIMAIHLVPNRSRVLRFSDHNVDYYGLPTGTVLHNNAVQLRITGCAVAAMTPSECYGITLDGPTMAPRNSTVTYEASSRCPGTGRNTGTISWFISINFSPFVLHQIRGYLGHLHSKFCSIDKCSIQSSYRLWGESILSNCLHLVSK